MRVLGIDPGSRFMGFGVVEEVRGSLVHVGHGVFKADPDAALELRLSDLFSQLEQTIRLYRPESVAVEGLFTFKNARSALVLGHARGVALLAAAQRGLPVHEYSPAKVKRSVGAGGADGKDAVARMVRTFLNISDFERADASDALAVAICHLNSTRPQLGGVRAKASGGAGASKSSSFTDRLSPSVVRFPARSGAGR